MFERARAAPAAAHAHLRRGAARHVGAAARLRGRRDGRGDAWLRIGALKGFVDGSLGSHTAAMLEPFTDAPNDRGLFVNTPEDLYRWTTGADAAGLHVIVHAIGDRAIRTQLDIYERVRRENGPRDRRFRIEHAQHLAPPDVPRFAALGVIASMQPYHAIDDGRWAERVIGPERAKLTYAFRSLLDAGARARVRQRLVRRAADAARGDLRRRHAPDARRRASRRLGSRAADHGRGGAARVHARRGVRVVRGEREGNARARQARGLRDHRPRPHAHRAGRDQRGARRDDRRRRPRRLLRRGAMKDGHPDASERSRHLRSPIRQRFLTSRRRSSVASLPRDDSRSLLEPNDLLARPLEVVDLRQDRVLELRRVADERVGRRRRA